MKEADKKYFCGITSVVLSQRLYDETVFCVYVVSEQTGVLKSEIIDFYTPIKIKYFSCEGVPGNYQTAFC